VRRRKPVSQLTDRQLWLDALNHRYSGRFPTDIWIRPEPENALIEHYGAKDFEEVQDILGITRMRSIGVRWARPDWEGRTDLQVLQSESPYGGGRYLLHDERTFENEWGVVMRVGSDSKYDEWIRGPLSEMDEPDASIVCTPPIEQLTYRSDLAGYVRRLKENGEFVTVGAAMPFKTAWHLRGMQNFLMDYYLHPEFVADLYDRLVERDLPRLRVAIEAGVDMVTITGDFAMQDRIIVGPDKWRAFDKVALLKLFDFCRSINPEIRFYVHSDGNVMNVMDDLVYDLGFDMINPMQPECMDLGRIKEKYGAHFVMYGCGSLQRTLPFGTPEEVRAEVREIIDRYGENGGLVVMPANVIGFDVPIENIIAFYETASRYFPY
jgi:uroporphyrinogen decarboxylase